MRRFFLFKGHHLQFNKSKLRWNLKLIRITSISRRLREMLRQCDKPSPFIVSGDYDYITNKIPIGLWFSFLDWWSLLVSPAAWAKKMSSEVCEEFSIILSSVGSKRAKLLSNCGRLSELELKKYCNAFFVLSSNLLYYMNKRNHYWNSTSIQVFMYIRNKKKDAKTNFILLYYLKKVNKYNYI